MPHSASFSLRPAWADAPIPRLLLESMVVADWLRGDRSFETAKHQREGVFGGIEECEKAVAELVQYGLLRLAEITCEGNDCRPARHVVTVQLHRLVQQLVRQHSLPVEALDVLTAVNNLLPVDPFDHRVWPLWCVLRPHAESLLAMIDGATALGRVAILSRRIGQYLHGIGEYATAETRLRQALELQQQLTGPDSLATSDVIELLADLLLDNGQLAAAEELVRQSLAIKQRQLPVGHPSLAEPLHLLGRVLKERCQYREAESCVRKALAIREHALGLEHPDLSASLNGLALLLVEQGQLDEAEALYYRSLRIAEEKLPLLHPDRATTLGNLAWLLSLQQKYPESEVLFRRAGDRRACLGTRSPGGVDHVEQFRAVARGAVAIPRGRSVVSAFSANHGADSLAVASRVRPHPGESRQTTQTPEAVSGSRVALPAGSGNP